ncbi:MAG: PilW family protein [Hylemonella sp.]|uniref:PilW family protein n=1 Tax=Hylemonella sp. TaxID=2066020 RepID=UPI00391A8035
MVQNFNVSRSRMAGFGLVEIMVAMLIGMFGVLIMMQVLTVSEEQKRTTTSGNDAMNEGVLALYAIQSDIRMAGYGINDPKILGCSLTLRAGVVLGALAPVVINSANITGADANTDTVMIFHGNSFGTPQGDTVIAAGNTVQTPTAFVANDWVVVAPTVRPAPCNLTLDRVANVAAGAVTLSSGTAMNVGDTLFNLGQSYRAVGYAVRNRNLTSCDYTNAGVDCSIAGSWNAIASNIFSLRAQYGRDTTAPTMDTFVDVYDQATPNPAVTPNTLCGWSRISAVRMALVARSAQMEKEEVTAAVPTWEGSAAGNPAGSTAAAFVLSGDADWKNYRYRVFQTLVPIRNMSWMGAVTGC